MLDSVHTEMRTYFVQLPWVSCGLMNAQGTVQNTWQSDQSTMMYLLLGADSDSNSNSNYYLKKGGEGGKDQMCQHHLWCSN